jgi:hypothetical protein
MSARNSDPESSHEASVSFEKHSGDVNMRITEIIRAAGRLGRTQSEVPGLSAQPGFSRAYSLRLRKRIPSSVRTQRTE